MVSVRFMLLCMTGWVNRKQQDAVAHLQEEVAVLREQRGPKQVDSLMINGDDSGLKTGIQLMRPYALNSTFYWKSFLRIAMELKNIPTSIAFRHKPQRGSETTQPSFFHMRLLG
jgi:hypothetical protein